MLINLKIQKIKSYRLLKIRFFITFLNISIAIIFI